MSHAQKAYTQQQQQQRSQLKWLMIIMSFGNMIFIRKSWRNIYTYIQRVVCTGCFEQFLLIMSQSGNFASNRLSGTGNRIENTVLYRFKQYMQQKCSVKPNIEKVDSFGRM